MCLYIIIYNIYIYIINHDFTSLMKSSSDMKQFPNPVRAEIHSLTHVKMLERKLWIDHLDDLIVIF